MPTRVLVVVPNDDIRRLLADQLRDEGFAVHAVSTYRQVRETLQYVQIDVALVDLDVVASVPLTHELRTRQIPLVAMADVDCHPDQLSSFGARAVIGKPVGLDAVVSAVRSATGCR